ncbi:hypothetical protein IFM89_016606 [Coptis chinensis]|uniref:poly(A)-specific ribonuclease n=1 Tax=Coptis chinensis TaxID=261450 RepID=A0A835M984_9MAGN|nr:hypothetical protein IFM89_016606 [Coptis chinensis]
MLTLVRVHLPSDIPIVGCELTPYILLQRPSDNSFITHDVPESSPIDRYYIRHKWYRIQSDKKVAVCSIHPLEQATLQCLGCLKAKVPALKSYHCSSRCFSDAWQHHRVLHDRPATAANENNGTEEEELFGRLGSAPVYPTAEKTSGEIWFEVGRSKTYTPTVDDIGHVLKFECVAVDAETKLPVGHAKAILTSRVIPAPTPTPRRLIPVDGIDMTSHLDLDGHTASSGTFTVLSYNILAEVYATTESYSYCPSWALSWSYRKQNLLREIVGYHADIICLQEVSNGTAHTVDGCATFFRRERFSHVKKYEVEFNKAAHSLTDALITNNPGLSRKTCLNRLLKDNVALIAVLEAKFNNHGTDAKRQLLCVANTHVHVNQDLKDVKLWQVHTLLKGLEKIAASADIPMLVCGDFNSVPGSAPHALLAMGKVEQMHPDLTIDPLGIVHPPAKLSHQLPLVSAYSSFARSRAPGLEQQRMRTDLTTNEPLFTYCTRDFICTVDYIFYTGNLMDWLLVSANSLSLESLLELLDEESLRKDTALPSPEWSSDHIALLAEFRCNSRARR